MISLASGRTSDSTKRVMRYRQIVLQLEALGWDRAPAVALVREQIGISSEDLQLLTYFLERS